MSNRTNDEKLRILQERLSQIKKKHETPVPSRFQREEVIEITTPEKKEPINEREPLNLSWVKKVVIVGSVAFGIYYGYTNIDFNSLVPDLSSEEVVEEQTPFELEYKLNLTGNQLAIIGSFEDESSARAMVNDLVVKGFKCDYFFLPKQSNSTDEIYNVFIGPYENEEETNQWTKNLETEFTIINL